MKILYFIAFVYHSLMRFIHIVPGKYQTKTFKHHHKKKKYFKGLLLIAIVLFIYAQPVIADLLTEQDQTVQTADKLLQSTVVVTNGMKRGTGFYISPNEIITNNHVVSDGLMWLKKANGEPCVALVKYTDVKRDLTLIKACESGIPLQLANNVRLGQSVLVMGNPQSMEFYLSKGIVSSLRVGGYMLHDAVTDHGNSGGAVVNLSGEVVGVSVANFKDNPSMSMAISVEDLKSFLKEVR